MRARCYASSHPRRRNHRLRENARRAPNPRPEASTRDARASGATSGTPWAHGPRAVVREPIAHNRPLHSRRHGRRFSAGVLTPKRDLDHIAAIIDQGWRRVSATSGYLSEREARFVMAAAALAPAQGKNLEIGSFKGRSTVGIAYVTRELGLGTVVAVDPHTSPATTDPDLRGKTTTYEDFVANLRTAGVFERVEIKRVYSHERAREWKDSIRFLWIDGDHTYEGAKADLDMFKPYLVDGAIVAMHDVLGTFEGAPVSYTHLTLPTNREV